MKPITINRVLAAGVLVALGVLLSACGGVQNYSWPGLTVAGETAYFAYSQHIAAINVRDGQQIWKYPNEVDSTLMFYGNPWIDAQGNLMAGSYYGSIVALHADSGQLLWKYTGAKTKIFSPLLETPEGVIASSEDGKLHFLNAEDGTLKQEINLGQSSWGPMAADAQRIYIGTLGHWVFALDAKTGAKIWGYDAGTSIADGVTLAGDKLLVGTFSNSVLALDAATGALLWKADADGWVWGAPTVDGNVAYFADLAGSVRSVSLADGKIIWRTTLGKPITTKIVLSGGKLFIGSDDNKVRALSLSDGAQKWEVTLEAPVHGTMAVAGDRLLVTLSGGTYPLAALSLENGSLLWKFEGVK
jgi:outer membrane protein assembly factor BamB